MTSAAADDAADAVAALSSSRAASAVSRFAQLVVLLLYVVQLLLLPSASIGQEIVSVSGCEDVYPVTVNCTRDSVLRLVTTGMTASPPSSPLCIISTGFVTKYGMQCSCALDPSDPSNSSFIASLSTCWRPRLGLGRMLNVSLSLSAVRSPPFPGFSQAYEPPPTLLSISGCQDDGGQLCDPWHSVLRISGSLLQQCQGLQLELRIEPASRQRSAAPAVQARTGWLSVNDTLLVVNLSSSGLSDALLPAHYGGLPLLLSLLLHFPPDHALVSSNALPVSFVPLPPPRVDSITSGNCDPPGWPGLSNCRPEVSSLYIAGSFMFSMQTEFWVGSDSPGVGFTRSQWREWAGPGNSPRVRLELPLLPQYEPGELYDLRVRVGAQTTTVRRVIAYTAAPSIIATTRCVVTGQELDLRTGGNCQPGQSIAISGLRLPADSSLRVNISHLGRYDSSTVQCLQPQRVNSSRVVCVLPTPPASFYNELLSLQLQYGDGSWLNSSNPLSVQLYSALNAPRITQVSGCGRSVHPLQLELCSEDDVVTISGSDLSFADANDSAPIVTDGPFHTGACCAVLPGWSNSSFRCRLYFSYGPYGPERTYVYSTAVPRAGRRQPLYADAFTVSFRAEQRAVPSAPFISEDAWLAMLLSVSCTLALLSLLLVAREVRVIARRRAAAAAAAAAGPPPGEGGLDSSAPAALRHRGPWQLVPAIRQPLQVLAVSLLPRPGLLILHERLQPLNPSMRPVVPAAEDC